MIYNQSNNKFIIYSLFRTPCIAVSDRVELVAKGITYLGPNVLNQFKISQISSAFLPDKAQFSMRFQRLFESQLLSVYIPSTCLLCVSLITNYVSNDHFEANIMVHLTTMLVMYKLFQAISVSLPQVKMRYNELCNLTFPSIRPPTWKWLIIGFSLDSPSRF